MSSKIESINFVKDRISFQERLVNSQHWQSCLNCEYFDKNLEFCEFHKAKPPIYIAVHGCERHIGDIPF